MVVQCPFCKQDWNQETLEMDDMSGRLEAYECDCGAWWYEGMEDEEDD